MGVAPPARGWAALAWSHQGRGVRSDGPTVQMPMGRYEPLMVFAIAPHPGVGLICQGRSCLGAASTLGDLQQPQLRALRLG